MALGFGLWALGSPRSSLSPRSSSDDACCGPKREPVDESRSLSVDACLQRAPSHR
jgi:hypothetical protein